jgi:hypothetical protein
MKAPFKICVILNSNKEKELIKTSIGNKKLEITILEINPTLFSGTKARRYNLILCDKSFLETGIGEFLIK